MKHISVIGAGAWGTVIAQILADNGHKVTLWCYKDDIASQINHQQTHHRLPWIQLTKGIHATNKMDECFDADVIILGFSSRQLVQYDDVIDWKKIQCPIGFLAKGIIEPDWFISTWLEQRISQPVFTVSGPNLALEIASKKPAAAVVACQQLSIARDLQHVLSNDYFRCYTSTDIRGVQCGGIFKNIFAIAAGCIDGLDLGYNSKAGLITRGMVELQRISQFFGAEESTILGLSGLGDLIATCSSSNSRNWQLGHTIVTSSNKNNWESTERGETEGIRTIKLIYDTIIDNQMNLPIIISIGRIFKENIEPKMIIQELMKRGLRSEFQH